MKYYAVSSSSMSHTFGNVTAFITEYVKSLFPINYFRTVNISSTMAYREFNIFNNTRKEFIKKTKPILIVRPRVDINNDDVFLNKSLLTTRITDNFLDRDFGNLQPFIIDEKTGIRVRYLLNRIKMFFDISILVETQMEQLNRALYLKNRVRQDLPFIIQTALEDTVPKQIMKSIANEANIDINNTKEFLDYINSVSCFPVTYKMKNSTGNDEFFRYYNAHIDSIILNLETDGGTKKGVIDDYYSINFTIETEFNTSGLYYIFSRNPKSLEPFNIALNDAGIVDSIIPSFTITTLFNEPLPPGWNYYVSTFYRVESSSKPDILDISSLINRSLQAAIDYHLEKGIILDKMIRFLVYKDNKLLNQYDGDFEVNFFNKELITNKVNQISTYRLVIVVNTLYINDLIGEMIEINNHR